MKQLIGCCGLDCEICKARKATLENNDVLREEVAAKWIKLNNFEIKPEWINCEGCRQDRLLRADVRNAEVRPRQRLRNLP